MFKFDSIHGVEHIITISKEGYSGVMKTRKLGRSPVLRKKKNGPVCGTSLEFYAECIIDGEFAELYTSDPYEYKVELYRGGYRIWFGFLSPEFYSEPSIAPPYDVEFVATDGIGELKKRRFVTNGETTLYSILDGILCLPDGIRLRNLYFISALKKQDSSPLNLPDWTIDVDFLAGETLYDVLTLILNTLHATITADHDYWLIIRETDFASLIQQNGTVKAISTRGLTPSYTYTDSIREIGRLSDAELWPIGFMSTEIVPARNSVSVKAPYYYIDNVLRNGDMATSSYWGYDNKVEHINDGGFYLAKNIDQTGALCMKSDYSVKHPNVNQAHYKAEAVLVSS